MSTEELLKKRVKVIAPYPNSPYKVGEILTEFFFDNGNSYFSVKESGFNEKVISSETIKECPNIFEELEWWEDLTETDLRNLPDYIMIDPEVEIEPPFCVYKIIKWELINGELEATTYKKEKMSNNSLRLFLPSNKIEFAKYIRERNKMIAETK